MLKQVLFASAALALLAAPSLAANSGLVNITGKVNPVCNMAYTSAAVHIGTINIVASTAVNDPQTVTEQVGTSGVTFCNSNGSTMKITVPVLTGSNAPAQLPSDPVQFTNLIPYTVTLPGDVARDSSVTAVPTVYTLPVGTFFHAVASTDLVTVATKAAVGPVVAGDYSAIITIELTPGS